MRIALAGPSIRPFLPILCGLGLAVALAAGPVTSAIETSDRIAAARERLARVRDAAARPPVPMPLTGPDTDALLAAFRLRLDALASGRAAIVDRVEVEPDPARPSLPRLSASLRGTAEGLHDLLHALETETPLVAIEMAEVAVERPADPETGRPTVMRLVFKARGVLIGAASEVGPAAAETGR